jgi:gliding motility-associated-like protein
MSVNIFKSTAALFILMLLTSGMVNAQMNFSRKYRVIAYKNGDLSTYSVSNEVEIIPAMTLYIPNSFTPNGDGLNDTFGIAGEAIKEFNMEIYNRWGQKIFESDNANLRWDGTFLGEKVPEGAYVYRVIAKGATGKKALKEGNISVIM